MSHNIGIYLTMSLSLPSPTNVCCKKNTCQMHPITHLIINPMPVRNCNLNATNKTSAVSIATSRGKHIERWPGSCKVKDRESACVKLDHRSETAWEKERGGDRVCVSYLRLWMVAAQPGDYIYLTPHNIVTWDGGKCKWARWMDTFRYLCYPRGSKIWKYGSTYG